MNQHGPVQYDLLLDSVLYHRQQMAAPLHDAKMIRSRFCWIAKMSSDSRKQSLVWLARNKRKCGCGHAYHPARTMRDNRTAWAVTSLSVRRDIVRDPRIDALRWLWKKQNGYGGTACASGATSRHPAKNIDLPRYFSNFDPRESFTDIRIPFSPENCEDPDHPALWIEVP